MLKPRMYTLIHCVHKHMQLAVIGDSAFIREQMIFPHFRGSYVALLLFLGNQYRWIPYMCNHAIPGTRLSLKDKAIRPSQMSF